MWFYAHQIANATFERWSSSHQFKEHWPNAIRRMQHFDSERVPGIQCGVIVYVMPLRHQGRDTSCKVMYVLDCLSDGVAPPYQELDINLRELKAELEESTDQRDFLPLGVDIESEFAILSLMRPGEFSASDSNDVREFLKLDPAFKYYIKRRDVPVGSAAGITSLRRPSVAYVGPPRLKVFNPAAPPTYSVEVDLSTLDGRLGAVPLVQKLLQKSMLEFMDSQLFDEKSPFRNKFVQNYSPMIRFDRSVAQNDKAALLEAFNAESPYRINDSNVAKDPLIVVPPDPIAPSSNSAVVPEPSLPSVPTATAAVPPSYGVPLPDMRTTSEHLESLEEVAISIGRYSAALQRIVEQQNVDRDLVLQRNEEVAKLKQDVVFAQAQLVRSQSDLHAKHSELIVTKDENEKQLLENQRLTGLLESRDEAMRQTLAEMQAAHAKELQDLNVKYQQEADRSMREIELQDRRLQHVLKSVAEFDAESAAPKDLELLNQLDEAHQLNELALDEIEELTKKIAALEDEIRSVRSNSHNAKPVPMQPRISDAQRAKHAVISSGSS